MDTGRINIHLHDTKKKLRNLHPGYGELTKIIRSLIDSYVEGRIMHLSPKISELLEQGKDEEAIELLTIDLVALRQRRVSAAQKATKSRTRSKTQKAKDKAGIKSAKRQDADRLVADMLAQHGEMTIEFKEGSDGDSKESDESGAARKVS